MHQCRPGGSDIIASTTNGSNHSGNTSRSPLRLSPVHCTTEIHPQYHHLTRRIPSRPNAPPPYQVTAPSTSLVDVAPRSRRYVPTTLVSQSVLLWPACNSKHLHLQVRRRIEPLDSRCVWLVGPSAHLLRTRQLGGWGKNDPHPGRWEWRKQMLPVDFLFVTSRIHPCSPIGIVRCALEQEHGTFILACHTLGANKRQPQLQRRHPLSLPRLAAACRITASFFSSLATASHSNHSLPGFCPPGWRAVPAHQSHHRRLKPVHCPNSLVFLGSLLCKSAFTHPTCARPRMLGRCAALTKNTIACSTFGPPRCRLLFYSIERP